MVIDLTLCALVFSTLGAFAGSIPVRTDLVNSWLGWALGTNYLMSQFPLAKFLAANIALWGIFLMAQGASKNFVDMAVLRVISGALYV